MTTKTKTTEMGEVIRLDDRRADVIGRLTRVVWNHAGYDLDDDEDRAEIIEALAQAVEAAAKAAKAAK